MTAGSEPAALAPVAALALLAAAGVPHAETLTADGPEAAEAAARTAGPGPFVLKAGGLLHKSDDGGVALGLADPEAVAAAARDLERRLGERARPLLLQRQHAGTEVLVGVRREPGVGAAVAVGLGGIHAEVLGDVRHAVAPLGRERAHALLRELRGWALLAGHRGAPAADVAALVDLVVAVSRLAEEHPELVELDLNPVLVGAPGAGALAVDVRALVAEPAAARDVDARGLGRLLCPRRVAIVGVSDDSAKSGARIHDHLLDHGFRGRVDAIHPRGGERRGQPRLRSLADVDGSPDLVSVSIPAAQVAPVVREAVALRPAGIVIHSSGFGETGAEGAALEAELRRLVAGTGVRLIGPNSMGIVSTPERAAVALGGMLRLPELAAGGIALLSSSGALGSSLASRLWEASVGISRWVSLGNEADVDAGDLLAWLAADDATRIVGLVLERIADGSRLRRGVAACVRAGKPVFACLLARSEGGRQAALSHTGALVGSHTLREDMLRAAGAVPVPTLRVLEDALVLADAHGLPAGPRLGAITASGGASAILADEAQRAGIELPELPAAVRERVAAVLPPYAAVRNPIDVTVQVIVDPGGFARALEALVAPEAFDALLVQYTTNADPTAERTAEVVRDVSANAPMPVFVGRYGARSLAPRGMAVYERAGIPVLDTPERAVAAIGALVAAGRSVAGGG